MPPVKKPVAKKPATPRARKHAGKTTPATEAPVVKKPSIKKAASKVKKAVTPKQVEKPKHSVVEVAVHGDGGDAFVRREQEEVWLKWLHGLAFRFRPEDLSDAIYYIDEFGTRSWVQLSDSFGDSFVARVSSNVLYIANNPQPLSSSLGIPWEHLQESLEEALA